VIFIVKFEVSASVSLCWCWQHKCNNNWWWADCRYSTTARLFSYKHIFCWWFRTFVRVTFFVWLFI